MRKLHFAEEATEAHRSWFVRPRSRTDKEDRTQDKSEAEVLEHSSVPREAELQSYCIGSQSSLLGTGILRIMGFAAASLASPCQLLLASCRHAIKNV